MQKEEIQRLIQSLDEKQFLELVYTVLSLHPQWVKNAVKAMNAAIKHEWIEND